MTRCTLGEAFFCDLNVSGRSRHPRRGEAPNDDDIDIIALNTHPNLVSTEIIIAVSFKDKNIKNQGSSHHGKYTLLWLASLRG